MTTIFERAVHSVDRVFSLYCVCYFGCFHFGFDGGTVFLIAPVPSRFFTFAFYLRFI